MSLRAETHPSVHGSRPLTPARRDPGQEPLRLCRGREVRLIRGRPVRAAARTGGEKRPEARCSRRGDRQPLTCRRTADSTHFRPEGGRGNAGRDRETGSPDLPCARVLRRSKRLYSLRGFYPTATRPHGAFARPNALSSSTQLEDRYAAVELVLPHMFQRPRGREGIDGARREGGADR
jgi:hypothetical protein